MGRVSSPLVTNGSNCHLASRGPQVVALVDHCVKKPLGLERFFGRRSCWPVLSQEYNRKSIKISLSKFAQDMEPVAVPKHVKDDLDAPLEANVHSQFRGGAGQLEWLQLHGNPLLSFAT